MADQRALSLDSLAVSDRFRLFNFTRRDDHVEYLWVLRAMDRLREVHHVQVDGEQVAAALAELAELHDDLPSIDANLRDRLDALYEDGVVHRFDDASRAGSLVRYRNRQSVYQFSELGYWAYTAVEGLLAARIQDANLSRLVFSDILEDLKALAAANRAGRPEQVYRRLSRLDSVMEDMGRRSAHFHVTLGEIMRSTDTSPDTFLRHKNALLTHMSDFMSELDRYLPRLDRAVHEVEETGLATLLARAAEADERPFMGEADRLEDWRRRWDALRAWFAPPASPSGGGTSRARELRAATRTAVSGVIALLRQITEAQRGGVNRSSQLRHLAEWVHDCPDEGAAHALMGAAFNLRSARHAGGAHDDDEQISPRSTWWDAPGVEISVTLFRSGKAPTPGLPQPVRANRGARAALRESQAAERAAERAAASGLVEEGAYDRVLDPTETRVLLKLLTKALESRSVVAGRLRGGTGTNDVMMIRLVPDASGSTVATTQGRLHLPGVRVELADRALSVGAPAGRGSSGQASSGASYGDASSGRALPGGVQPDRASSGEAVSGRASTGDESFEDALSGRALSEEPLPGRGPSGRAGGVVRAAGERLMSPRTRAARDVEPGDLGSYQQAVRRVLTCDLITPARPRPGVLDQVLRWADELTRDLRELFGYSLIASTHMVRLVRRLDALDPTQRSVFARKGKPFDRRRLAYLCLVLASFQRSRVEISLADLVRVFTPAANAIEGLGFDPTVVAHKAAVVDVLDWLVDRGALRLSDGSLESWVRDTGQGDALYDIDHEICAVLFRPARPIQHLTSVAGLLDEPMGPGLPRDAVLRRARRLLVEHPVVYFADVAPAIADALRTPALAADLARLTGLVVERRAEGIMLADPGGVFTDRPFPGRGGAVNRTAGLLLAKIADLLEDRSHTPPLLPAPVPAEDHAGLVARVDAGLPREGVVAELAWTTPEPEYGAAPGPEPLPAAELPLVETSRLETMIDELFEEFGPASFTGLWQQDPRGLLAAAISYLADLSLLRPVPGGVLVPPAALRYRNIRAALPERPQDDRLPLELPTAEVRGAS